MSLEIGYVTLGMVATNSFFVHGKTEDGKDLSKVLFFDPADRGGYLYDRLTEKGMQIEAILLTHGHYDHILGVAEMREKSGAKVYAYEDEKDLLLNPSLNLSESIGRPCRVEPDVWLKDGEIFELAGLSITCIATPGHTKGSCCYYIPEHKVLFSGDTLFEESVGRTDFPTGSMSEIVRSIREKLFILPDDVTVYPGHGDLTSIGTEKRYNPFVQGE